MRVCISNLAPKRAQPCRSEGLHQNMEEVSSRDSGWACLTKDDCWCWESNDAEALVFPLGPFFLHVGV